MLVVVWFYLEQLSNGRIRKLSMDELPKAREYDVRLYYLVKTLGCIRGLYGAGRPGLAR